MPSTSILHGDKGYDSDAVRRKIESLGAAPNIPPKKIAVGKTVSRRSSTATETPSSECWEG
jgi:hypothetical protein